MMKPEAPLPAEAWGAGRSIGSPVLSPDGSTVAFRTKAGDGSKLALIPSNGGLERCIYTPVSPGGAIRWTFDGSALVFEGSDGKIYAVDLANEAIRTVAEWPDQLSSTTVSPDGRSVAFVADMHEVGVVAIDGGSWPVRISSDADFAFDPAWSSDGEWIAWQEWDVPDMAWDASRIAVRRSDASSPVITVAGGSGMSVQQPRFSSDGSKLGFLSDADGWLNVWVCDVPEFDNARPVVSEEFEHGDPSWGPGQSSWVWVDANTIALCRNEKGRGRLVLVDVSSREVTVLDSATYTALSSANGMLAGIASGPLRAATLTALDTNNGQRIELARGPVAGVEREGVEPEDVSWEAESGTVHGRLYRAPSRHAADLEDPPPLIVWLHGGPTSQSQATLYPRWSYFLARGYSVLNVDYHGTTGWGREYALAMRGRWGEIDVDDTLAGIHAAIENGWGDKHRIVLMGGSSAGTTVLLTMAQNPSLCAAGVAMYPVCDMVATARDTWRFEAHYFDTLIGPLPETLPLYLKRSPNHSNAKVSDPVFILHGSNDRVVPIQQAVDFTNATESATLHVYEGEGHGWRRPDTVADELRRVEEFLNRHVRRDA